MDAHYLRLLNGSPIQAGESLRLRAGPLSLLYDQGSLRSIQLGETELIRQIYSAVRDRNWGTVPGKLEIALLNAELDHFEIRFESVHQRNEIDFRWQGHILGNRDGSIRFHMVGEAHSRFERNRIGFCILHPMSCAGKRCRIEQVDGMFIESQFPVNISPHQPFKSIRAIQHEYDAGQWAEVRMEGDSFEMEDQRNWIDASYKTYCTPLDIPFPVTVEAGTHIEQTITVRLLNAPSENLQIQERQSSIDLDMAASVPLPQIGLAAASHTEPLSQRACERLRQLQLAHLRLDVRFDQADWPEILRADIEEAQCIGASVELALHLGEEADSQLQALRQLLETADVQVLRYLIFRQGEKSTSSRWLRLARQILGDGAVLVGGTDAFFTELNRERPEHEVMDGVVYSINPQVHAFDDVSLVETLQAHAPTVQTARTFSGAKPIHVGPVTFRMRWNPNATAAPPPPAPDELPHQADPRQMSLFGAGWTLNSIKYLALGGAQSLTYYETSGYMGVMSTEAGSALPELFWDVPGGVYPMYHVFADYSDFRDGQLVDLKSSDPMRVDGCGLKLGANRRYLLANLTHEQQECRLNVSGNFRLRRLDHHNSDFAMREPEAYRSQSWEAITATQAGLALTLSPFSVITIDQDPV